MGLEPIPSLTEEGRAFLYIIQEDKSEPPLGIEPSLQPYQGRVRAIITLAATVEPVGIEPTELRLQGGVVPQYWPRSGTAGNRTPTSGVRYQRAPVSTTAPAPAWRRTSSRLAASFPGRVRLAGIEPARSSLSRWCPSIGLQTRSDGRAETTLSSRCRLGSQPKPLPIANSSAR